MKVRNSNKDEGEAQKIESLRFSEPPMSAALHREAAELDQTGFLRMEYTLLCPQGQACLRAGRQAMGAGHRRGLRGIPQGGLDAPDDGRHREGVGRLPPDRDRATAPVIGDESARRVPDSSRLPSNEYML